MLDGPLHGIGIDTLICGGHAVIEKASVEIAPSLWLLNQRTTEWKSGRAALLVGDAIEVVPEFPALAGAADELTSIASLLGNPPAKVIRGGDANPQTIRSMPLDAYGVIHFAAHANANRLNPLESAIVLSKSREGDYQLFARQILEQKLSNPLVTLSACRSAGARSFSGEGFVGLTWAFLQAGAQGVVAGLWAVDDAASQKLMDDFYMRLRDGKPPLIALTEAKRKHLSGGAPLHKPYYWAGWQYFTSSL